MNPKGKQYEEQLESLSAIIEEDEPKFKQLEKEFLAKEKAYSEWKRHYDNDSNNVAKKGCLLFILIAGFIFVAMLLDLFSSGWHFVGAIAFGVFVYFVFTWEERDSRNQSQKFLEDSEKQYNDIRPRYQDYKNKHEANKKMFSSLQNEYMKWKEERDAFIRRSCNKKSYSSRLNLHDSPFELFGFPEDPVIDQSCYPLGTIDSPKKFMVYSARAHRYHIKRGCSGAYYEISISEALDNKMSPCLICCALKGDFEYPDWVHTVRNNYLQLVRECDRFDIETCINKNGLLEMNIPFNDLDRLGYIQLEVKKPFELYFTFPPSSIDEEGLSDFEKERIALIMSIIDAGVSKYLGFSEEVFIDNDFLPLSKPSDSSFVKLYQNRCLLLNKDLKKYNLELWVNERKAVLSIPVVYALSLPRKYKEQAISYLVRHCGLKIDYAEP